MNDAEKFEFEIVKLIEWINVIDNLPECNDMPIKNSLYLGTILKQMKKYIKGK